MKKFIMSLFVISLISGCSTTPSVPEPHPAKYTLQVIRIEIPEVIVLDPAPDIEKMIHHPTAEIIEYPIVIAGMGESVTNDQTKAVLMAEDYDIVNGQTVAKEKIQQLGYLVSVKINEIKVDAISCHLKAYYKELTAFDEYEVEDGITVKIPFFKASKINTNLTLEPNTWTLLGGLVDERSTGKKMTRMIVVRIIPPNTDR